MQYLTILGSTGSVGQSTISVIQQHNDKFSVYALVANNNIALMIQQCLIVSPKYVCMVCKDAAEILKKKLVALGKHNIKVLSGTLNACTLAALDEIDIVISAIVGIAGLKPTFSALRAGKKILLANKETLVVSGKLFMKEANKYNSCILPVDSEHNAIFQNLPSTCQEKIGQLPLSEYGVSCILLTASGGVFLKTPRNQLSRVTPKQACIHPNWSMGRKISVDSATMMNKGLEYIEARHLFNADSDEIEILLHPQSIVHAMVRYNDGSILMHLSPPDMKVPIAHALAYPNRIKLKNHDIPMTKFNMDNVFCLNKLYFDQLDSKDYPCLKLAIDASNSGQSASIILNAANEVAVEAFLNEMISFTAIPDLVERMLNTVSLNEPNSLEDILYIDRKTREIAIRYIIHDL